MTKVTVETLFKALREAGTVQYGTEPITELEHALQIADLADEMSGDPELVCAALLHDIGRVAVRQDQISDTLVPDFMGKTPEDAHGHDAAGAALVGAVFPERVVYCIRRHVDAKRYLCTVQPEYMELISGGSAHTLKLQGGTMSEDERRAFESHPYHGDAVQVRRWDDMAKVVGKKTRDLEHWRPLVQSLMH